MNLTIFFKQSFSIIYRYIITHPNIFFIALGIWFLLCGFMEQLEQRAKRKNKIFFIWKVLRGFVLVCCIFIFLYVTLCNRSQTTYMRCKLELFWSYKEVIFHKNQFILWQILWNILAFLPIGNAIYYLLGARRKLYKVVLYCCVFSLGIELSQLIFRIGLFEFDDILHNTLGAVVGYLVAKSCCLIGRFWKRWQV